MSESCPVDSAAPYPARNVSRKGKIALMNATVDADNDEVDETRLRPAMRGMDPTSTGR